METSNPNNRVQWGVSRGVDAGLEPHAADKGLAISPCREDAAARERRVSHAVAEPQAAASLRGAAKQVFDEIIKSPNPQIPKSLAPRPSPLAPPRGFTLIEMLIVIGIMLILVGTAATMMKPASESRRIREAARMINIYLSTARNRAMELGRPCGVTFRCFATGQPGFALNADQCEVPPCYCGQSEQSVATVSLQLAFQPNLSNLVNVSFFDGSTQETLPDKMIRPGDCIQFAGQGPLYQIASGGNGVDANGYLNATGSLTATLDGTLVQAVPWPVTPTQSLPMPYRIFRSPVKGSATPLQLPAGSVVDLEASGHGLTAPGQQDLTIVFSPTGAVQAVYHGANLETVRQTIYYLLVGRRERVKSTGNFIVDDANEISMANWQDLNNIWVTINLQTGGVSTEPVASSLGSATAGASIDAARGLAQQGQGMGGR
jgi:prepilin-type N-terminal cleavage/methylation domain-containing protein